MLIYFMKFFISLQGLLVLFSSLMMINCDHRDHVSTPSDNTSSFNDSFYVRHDLNIKSVITDSSYLPRQSVSLYKTEFGLYLFDYLEGKRYLLKSQIAQYPILPVANSNSLSHEQYLDRQTVDELKKRNLNIHFSASDDEPTFRSLERFLESRYRGSPPNQDFKTILDSILWLYDGFRPYSKEAFYTMAIKKLVSKNIQTDFVEYDYASSLDELLNLGAFWAKLPDTYLYENKGIYFYVRLEHNNKITGTGESNAVYLLNSSIYRISTLYIYWLRQ